MFLLLIYLVSVLSYVFVLSYTHLLILLVIWHSLIHFPTYDSTIWSRDSVFRVMTRHRVGSKRNYGSIVVSGVFIFIRRPSTLCTLDSDTIAKLKNIYHIRLYLLVWIVYLFIYLFIYLFFRCFIFSSYFHLPRVS